MKKLIVVLLMAFISFGMGVGAWAAMLPLSGNARIDSLSTDVRQVEDVDLIWLYPNKVLEYKNSADFRLGDLSGGGLTEWGGILMDMGDDFGVLGTFVNRPWLSEKPAMMVVNNGALLAIFNWFPIGAQGYFASNYSNNYSNNLLDLFWAKSLGGADLGLHFNYGETFSAIQSENFGLSVGLGFANVGLFSQGNIHADFLMNKVTDGAVKDNGIYNIEFGTLWQAGLDADNDIRLFGDMNQDQCNLSSHNTSFTLIDLGTSINHKIADGKGLISMGLILDYAGGSDKNSGENLDSWTAIWNASVEARVADWLTLRSGIEKAIVARIYDSTLAPTYQENIWNNVGFSTGFGINWQNWTLDVATDVSSLENSIQNVQPGNGIFFAGDILQSIEANLTYKF